MAFNILTYFLFYLKLLNPLLLFITIIIGPIGPNIRKDKPDKGFGGPIGRAFYRSIIFNWTDL